MGASSKISVNVALCGSIPRSCLGNGCDTKLAIRSNRADPTHSIPAAAGGSQSMTALVSLVESIDVPTWAVPASCDARLEPICNAIEHHPRLNLIQRASFLIGRSPTAQLQLLHKTCSRIHALLVHHTNGSFLLKDLESGHGTFVNGVAIPKNVWFKLKKGSLIRFGSGYDAPAFLFKSFCVGFDRMVSDLDHISHALNTTSTSTITATASADNAVKESHCHKNLSSMQPSSTPSTFNEVVSCIRGDGGMACILDGGDAPAAALTLLHTRMNACGQELLSTRESNVIRQAIDHFSVQCCSSEEDEHHQVVLRPKKRRKRSPDLHVSFSVDAAKVFYPPAVTPDEYSSDDDHSI